MALDLTTLYVVAAFGTMVAGIVHLVPAIAGRFGRWALLWGLGHVLLAATALVGVMPAGADVADMIRVANPLSVVAYALIVCGMREFRHARSRVLPVVAVAAVVGLPLVFSTDPGAFGTRVAYLSIVRALFDGAIVAIAIDLARRERLQTGWLMAVLFLAAVPLFLGRAWLAYTGQLGGRLTGFHADIGAWLAAGQIAFIVFRAYALLILQAERSQASLVEQMARDPLTGAYNRIGLDRLQRGISGSVAILMIDVDRFKLLNDTHGHVAGDAALRIVCDVAREEIDARGAVVRWGGDEFVCILPGVAHPEASAIAEAIGARFAVAICDVMHGPQRPALSIGVVVGAIGASFDSLLQDADSAMYAIKARRRDRRAAIARAA